MLTPGSHFSWCPSLVQLCWNEAPAKQTRELSMVDAKPIIWPIVSLGCSLVIVGALQPQVAATPHQITTRQVHSEIFLSPPSPVCSLNLHMRGFVPEVSCVCRLVWGSDDPSRSHLPLTESLLFKPILSRFQFQSTMKYDIFTISPDVN